MSRGRTKIKLIKSLILLAFSATFLSVGAGAIWLSTLKMPDLNAFEARKVAQSTKIFDRTGSILLYDVNTDIRRTVVPLEDISPFIQKATVAIEDADFYKHFGIRPTAIIRAAISDILARGANQGGSTITQQVVKNALLTQDKTISRKIKEWVLAIKLEKIMTKNQILEAYLNESPYGGTMYGVEEASQTFFGKTSKDVTLAEAAYLASIPQAPTYYSPFGTHRDALDSRQKLVLTKMKEEGLITKDEYDNASKEQVQFSSKNTGGIKAPHFVMMVKDYLAEKYGEEVVNQGGLKVITTLDFDMQKKAEDVVTKFSPSLATNFNASNTSIVAIDPKTGDVLTLVGSKDYFDVSINGNYNVALALRQPGSTFKPFVYATAFKKGYTPNTVLFDVKTEFSTQCTPEGKPKNPSASQKTCYSPDEFDNLYPGPMIMRYSLAQSRNIPAVKTLYLVGISDAMQTAEDLGITTLTDPNRYGLTLVLGGGEVRLIDLTSAYGVFANDGIRNPYRIVLEVDDNEGNILEKTATSPSQVIDQNVVRQISDILSDNSVRMNSLKPIADGVGRTVAIKTGTTNDYRDVWTVGYTPNLVVGAWAGNSDNTPMEHNVAGLIISPLWGAFMAQAVKNLPVENFQQPSREVTDNKPVLHGIWQGGASYWKDLITGKLATENTPPELKTEVVFNNVHTILHWVDKSNPNGPVPAHPDQDSQYANWEYGVRKWFDAYKLANPGFKEETNITIPTESDDVHTSDKVPKITITSPNNGAAINPKSSLVVSIGASSAFPIKKTEVYVNGKFVMTATDNPLNFSFFPDDVGGLGDNNTLSVIVYDSVGNKAEATVNFTVMK